MLAKVLMRFEYFPKMLFLTNVSRVSLEIEFLNFSGLSILTINDHFSILAQTRNALKTFKRGKIKKCFPQINEREREKERRGLLVQLD